MPDSRDRPNILLILTDQHRYDALGCHGTTPCRTPNIDSLAERGVRFTSAFTGAVACSPSRASLFTGVYPHRHGVTSNNLVVNPALPTLSSELGGAGYRLGYAGKWHVDNARMPSDYGFSGLDFPGYGYPTADGTIDGVWFHRGSVLNGLDNVTPHYANYLRSHDLEAPRILQAHYGDKPTPGRRRHEIRGLLTGDVESTFEAMVSELAIEQLCELAGGEPTAAEGRGMERQPFFLWVNYWGPHTPCIVPEPYYSMYDPEKIPPEPSAVETWDHKPHRQKLGERFWGLSGQGWEGWREIVARYWGYVTMLDDLIGRVLGELDDLGLRENTVVVFASDHGDMMGAHRLIEKGPYAYDEALRIPLIVSHPECATPGTACDNLVTLHDLFPSCLEWAGAPLPPSHGKSLVGQACGQEPETLRESLFAYSCHGMQHALRAVRTRDHKLVITPTEMGPGLDQVNDPWEIAELYDLKADPHELTNLINEPGAEAVQQAMLAQMEKHLVELEDPFLAYYQSVRHLF